MSPLEVSLYKDPPPREVSPVEVGSDVEVLLQEDDHVGLREGGEGSVQDHLVVAGDPQGHVVTSGIVTQELLRGTRRRRGQGSAE